MLYLREHRFVALHIACGDITDVSIDGETLTIKTPDKTVLSLLEDGKREIERALSWQGKELKVEVQEKIVELSALDKDEQALKKVFGNKFNVKE